MVVVNSSTIEDILHQLQKNYGPLGFEFHPFKIGWYNAFVRPTFKLDYDEDTVAFLIISAPRMFENAFIPFLLQRSNQLVGINDPIDECMKFYFSKIPEVFPSDKVKVVHDFELHPNRRPKIVMQSVAHAAGAAYLYHPNSLDLDNEKKKKMFGVCIHPKYGGWFALRGVAFFENLECPDLDRIPPSDVVPSKDDKIRLLELYNFNWTDWRFRDIIPVAEKYSDLQIKYFTATPGNREKVINEIISTYQYANGS
ncbi:Methylmalonic aciduria and homocystinuria type C [Araneus ventricosus]|uniref:Cyanocobalamin reductase (cyanide-eliminating) n=1 Tax=Araneus ventricosus TaxID=182803 RepID=A0A4Y2SG02_ARAVE|nr:Methylmalonic aciduria and homocystinuria type C [Araneus ventricosus]GBN87193.1 Methylmalonic aciduria and homocystinuria type C [Araneus ventricosus]GBN88568.1 Methylmalonic aciduria and homocystinuria type C [Araneus ventricosus]GBN88571.1 Methylmalonic aciduria and homocystinuria type C [Araneus ventricosus]